MASVCNAAPAPEDDDRKKRTNNKEGSYPESAEVTEEQSTDSINEPSLNPFDPENLRLNNPNELAVERVYTNIACRKPNKQEFVRAHLDESYRLVAAVIEDKVHREIYLVVPEIARQIPNEVSPVMLLTAINRHGELFVWPLKLPSPDGRSNTWNESAMSGSQVAQTHWVRVKTNMSAQRYEIFKAKGEIPQPEWPELSLTEILTVCFGQRIIDSLDHPFLKGLEGEL